MLLLLRKEYNSLLIVAALKKRAEGCMDALLLLHPASLSTVGAVVAIVFGDSPRKLLRLLNSALPGLSKLHLEDAYLIIGGSLREISKEMVNN